MEFLICNLSKAIESETLKFSNYSRIDMRKVVPLANWVLLSLVVNGDTTIKQFIGWTRCKNRTELLIIELIFFNWYLNEY